MAGESTRSVLDRAVDQEAFAKDFGSPAKARATPTCRASKIGTSFALRDSPGISAHKYFEWPGGGLFIFAQP